jgi:hypothetical protein
MSQKGTPKGGDDHKSQVKRRRVQPLDVGTSGQFYNRDVEIMGTYVPGRVVWDT